MKKIIVTITVFLLTGCFSEISKGYINKECNKQEYINKININKTIKLKSKEDNLISLIINETYDSDKEITPILNSKKSEQNIYKFENGIAVRTENNTFVYEIDINAASEVVINRFNIKKEMHKMIKYYEDEGFKCN